MGYLSAGIATRNRLVFGPGNMEESRESHFQRYNKRLPFVYCALDKLTHYASTAFPYG